MSRVTPEDAPGAEQQAAAPDVFVTDKGSSFDQQVPRAQEVQGLLSSSSRYELQDERNAFEVPDGGFPDDDVPDGGFPDDPDAPWRTVTAPSSPAGAFPSVTEDDGLFRPGTRVVIKGLTNNTSNNGEIAEVIRYVYSMGKYLVRVESSRKKVRLSPENVSFYKVSDGDPAPPPLSPPPPEAPPSQSETAFMFAEAAAPPPASQDQPQAKLQPPPRTSPPQQAPPSQTETGFMNAEAAAPPPASQDQPQAPLAIAEPAEPAAPAAAGS